MTYLITGGAGFIGSHVVRDLVRGGESVIVYDVFPRRDTLELTLNRDEIDKSVKLIQGDVTDYAHLIKTLKENNVDTIIHLAAVMILEF
jgi:UDP-glucose 4-epimerase